MTKLEAAAIECIKNAFSWYSEALNVTDDAVMPVNARVKFRQLRASAAEDVENILHLDTFDNKKVLDIIEAASVTLFGAYVEVFELDRAVHNAYPEPKDADVYTSAISAANQAAEVVDNLRSAWCEAEYVPVGMNE